MSLDMNEIDLTGPLSNLSNKFGSTDKYWGGSTI